MYCVKIIIYDTHFLKIKISAQDNFFQFHFQHNSMNNMSKGIISNY